MSSSTTNHFTPLTIPLFSNYTIIHPSFTIPFTLIIIILLLLLETPYRNPLIIHLDKFKSLRPQLIIKSFTATVFAVMMYNIYSIYDIRRRSVDAVINYPDHVILVYHTIEACLMGFSLFLLVTVNRLQQYVKEVVMVKETIHAAKKQNRTYECCMKKSAEEAESIRKDISRLKTEITNWESECSMKEHTVQLLRADSNELKSRLEGLFEEYDRLLAYNKDLKEQLQGVNERLSHSNGIMSAFFSWDRWGL